MKSFDAAFSEMPLPLSVTVRRHMFLLWPSTVTSMLIKPLGLSPMLSIEFLTMFISPRSKSIGSKLTLTWLDGVL